MDAQPLWSDLAATQPAADPSCGWHPGASGDDLPAIGRFVLGFWTIGQVVSSCFRWREEADWSREAAEAFWQDSETYNEVPAPDWWRELGEPPPGMTWREP